MAQSLFDPSWYRMAPLRLRLRGHVELHRHRFRGQLWYVLQDHQSGRYHRLSPAANLFISLMDGRRTLDEIWNITGARHADDPPTQAEAIRLLAQLHSNDLLQGDVPPDVTELAERAARQGRQDMLGRFRNPLALRWPLFDPDRLLDRLAPLFRPVFTIWGFLAWLVLVGTGIVLAVLHWGALTATSADQLISAGNIGLTLLIYPLIKLLHEFGHGIAAKVWGGRVHETGIMLLVMMPVPYVDASSTTSFPGKWRRIVVAGAGIMVEFGLAAGAMILWTQMEPGLARAAAFNTMLIGSVSTLLFNGNPLLRYDAFYILSDLIEIPNLASRANRYVLYLIQHYLLGLENSENPVTAPGEARWFLFYALASWIYRMFLTFAIALLVATKLFWVGTALAIYFLFSSLILPLVKGAHFLMTSPRVKGKGARAFWVTGGGLAVIAAALFAVPLPYATVTEGVVWPPSGSDLRVATAGNVAEILAAPDSVVMRGQPLLRLEDPTLAATIALMETQREGLQLQLETVRFADRVRADILTEQLRGIDATLDNARQRREGLVIRAGLDGRFVLPRATDLTGRFLRQGDLAGHVVPPGALPVRTVASQAEVDLVLGATSRIDLLYATDDSGPVPARMTAAVPAAQTDLPALALAREGGGAIITSRGRDGSAQALEGLFVFDLLPSGTPEGLLGSRVLVRFDHGRAPLAPRIARSLRQLFLSYFNV